MPASGKDTDDDLETAMELQFGDNTRSVMMGCMIILLVEGVVVLIMHTNLIRILEGTLLTGTPSNFVSSRAFAPSDSLCASVWQHPR